MSDTQYLILIVDDNLQNLQFLGGILREAGYKIGIAQDGKKALEFLEDKKPDLILLDVMMPGMDGYEACQKIKKDYGTKHIPIIFLTAKSETEDIVKGFELGGVDYVTKPFIVAELLARIKTHIEMKVLRGMLPICASCKSIRDEKGFWNKLESYVESHSDVTFSHGVCLDCAEKLYGDTKWFKNRQKEQNNE